MLLINRPTRPVLSAVLSTKFSGFVLFCLYFMLTCALAVAQKADTSKLLPIIIKNSRNSTSIVTDTGDVNKLNGDVIMEQGTSTMYCDSCNLNVKRNEMEAFGHVRIVQTGGTEADADYMHYTGNTKLAILHGNVSLTDTSGKLKCEDLVYNMNTKTGVYTTGGTLQNDSTVVTSKTGTYNSGTKDSRFEGNVVITDPRYHIKSEDLSYNTATKIVEFFSPSVVTGEKSILHTTCGTYDSKNEIAHFPCHSSAWYDERYIEGDTLNSSKLSGYSSADGHVISIDTAHHSTLFSGHADYYRKTRILWATINPVLRQLNNGDSLFIAADTFYSAPVRQKTDSVKKLSHKEKPKPEQAKTKKKNKATETFGKATVTHETEIGTDTASDADSTAPRYYIGYHHVLIYSDSLQGRCDSISYTENDSIMRMIYTPIAWSHKSQITGDTILLKLDSGKLKSLFVPNNAYVVSQSGPPKANLYDQIQGKTLTAHFVNNAISDMLVLPEAESIYYSKDEKGAYLGVTQGQSERMHILFKDQKIERIICEENPHQVMTPLSKADIPNMRLSRFQWLEEKRPKSKSELFKEQIPEKK